MQHNELFPGTVVSLPAPADAPRQVHIFSKAECEAVTAAIAAGRALLVRGEPGTGKTQLARAVAQQLGWGIVSFTVDSRTDARDLLWHFDAVARLGEAQVQGNRPRDGSARPGARHALALRNFILPRPLWWAFNWPHAVAQALRTRAPIPFQPPGCEPAHGVVVLIDEIDKADTDVPNGLLEALGTGEFTPQGFSTPVRLPEGGRYPLVIITTNEERSLPDAFVRRCLVLHQELPQDEAELIEMFVQRGQQHFPEVAKDILQRAAQLLAEDRGTAQRAGWRPYPGQAEYLDLVRSISTTAAGDPARQAALLETNARYVLRKHPDWRTEPADR